MIARMLAIADTLAEGIARHLSAYVPGATVRREYVPEVDDSRFEDWIDSATPLGGYVVPVEKTSEQHTRGDDLVSYRYAVIFAEKCTLQPAPDDPEWLRRWLDVRVSAIDTLDDCFGDSRNATETEDGLLWAHESAIVLPFDAEVLREKKAFWSVWSLTLRAHKRVRR